jgi:very-short-patch-repair endonuclease
MQIINDQVKLLRKKTTKAEKILWEELRNRKLLGYKFYRQYPIIFDLLGYETFYVLDFYCFERKKAIELDGKIHQFKKREDKERENNLIRLGIKIIRFKNMEVEHDMNDVLIRLKKFI